jgi:hypothetical protein
VLEGEGWRIESFDITEAEGGRSLAIAAAVPAGAREEAVTRLSELEQVLGVRWGR